MDLNELTVEDLRILRTSLALLTVDSPSVATALNGLDVTLLEAIQDKQATLHMIETGRYPIWYKGVSR